MGGQILMPDLEVENILLYLKLRLQEMLKDLCIYGSKNK
jgi:hypothetical protein